MAPDFYNGTDPYTLPLYSQREAAQIIGASPSTLRGWVAPTDSRAETAGPVIHLPVGGDGRLSFYNVIEAYVLNIIRSHGVSMRAVRLAVMHAEREMQVERLLIRRELRWVENGHLFWNELSSLINLTRSGQLAMRELVQSYLHRVGWDDETGLPTHFFPLIETRDQAQSVVVDPRVSFGQPTVAGTGVGTAIIARRINAGESLESVAEDYGVPPDVVTEALLYQSTR